MKIMKKCISFILLIFCCSNTIQAFDDSTLIAAGLQKHYIQGSDVKVANNGIFVNFEVCILNVPSVYSDLQGSYIISLGSCSECGLPNDDEGSCQNPTCPNYGS